MSGGVYGGGIVHTGLWSGGVWVPDSKSLYKIWLIVSICLARVNHPPGLKLFPVIFYLSLTVPD